MTSVIDLLKATPNMTLSQSTLNHAAAELLLEALREYSPEPHEASMHEELVAKLRTEVNDPLLRLQHLASDIFRARLSSSDCCPFKALEATINELACSSEIIIKGAK